ncbi:MAG: phage replisome organizer N-terminal domain-containing protein [Desulfobulbaceae bacterium]|nr:phage replisome organizer N-terminal domain-containing protein [Desulfobulbaceae bacterium]
MNWVKIRCDILDHRKIKLLRTRPRGNELLLIWMLTIVCHNLKLSPRLFFLRIDK